MGELGTEVQFPSLFGGNADHARGAVALLHTHILQIEQHHTHPRLLHGGKDLVAHAAVKLRHPGVPLQAHAVQISRTGLTGLAGHRPNESVQILPLPPQPIHAHRIGRRLCPDAGGRNISAPTGLRRAHQLRVQLSQPIQSGLAIRFIVRHDLRHRLQVLLFREVFLCQRRCFRPVRRADHQTAHHQHRRQQQCRCAKFSFHSVRLPFYMVRARFRPVG